jgi:hypothetical protein
LHHRDLNILDYPIAYCILFKGQDKVKKISVYFSVERHFIVQISDNAVTDSSRGSVWARDIAKDYLILIVMAEANRCEIHQG